MTQSALAKKAGVSQSTIAKIERAKIKGSYTEVVKLLVTLDEEAAKRSDRVSLKDISTKRIIGVQQDEQVRKASDLMKEFDLSQMPVFDGDRPVGSISEKCILGLILGGVKPDDVGRRPVRSIMDDPFPVVNEDVEKDAVESLIRAEHAILTIRNGKITGIVTGADLFQTDWTI